MNPAPGPAAVRKKIPVFAGFLLAEGKKAGKLFICIVFSIMTDVAFYFGEQKRRGSMKEFQILDIKRSIFDDNDRQARQLRERLKKEQVFLLNLMSAPCSGKTTLLRRTAAALREELQMGVMEADIDSEENRQCLNGFSNMLLRLSVTLKIKMAHLRNI